ncbi:unnamed protein product [Linum tenue]|uniref:Uncharacterized protein n=1 Tax=Linum tenue TaxID=586396 RepID=A0AAV0JLP7_9ROSI|nr:unnamed protein product [Linum tenue]
MKNRLAVHHSQHISEKQSCLSPNPSAARFQSPSPEPLSRMEAMEIPWQTPGVHQIKIARNGEAGAVSSEQNFGPRSLHEYRCNHSFMYLATYVTFRYPMLARLICIDSTLSIAGSSFGTVRMLDRFAV